MQVVFTFSSLTTRGRMDPGDMVDLPDDEALHLIACGICHEHRTVLPESYSGPAGVSAPAGHLLAADAGAAGAAGAAADDADADIDAAVSRPQQEQPDRRRRR